MAGFPKLLRYSGECSGIHIHTVWYSSMKHNLHRW